MGDKAAMDSGNPVMEAPEAVSASRSKPDKVTQEGTDPPFKKPGDPFKIPTLVKAKGTGKPSTGGADSPKAVSNTNELTAPGPGDRDPASVATPGDPESDGFTAPSGTAPRLPSTIHSKPPKGPAAPLPKAPAAGEPATPKDPAAASAASSVRPAVPRGAAGGPPSFRPPAWAGCPRQPHALEVLRAGQIVDTVPLSGRSCVVFGRLPDCDVRLEHPSISRHHAALVYRASGDDGHETGYYLHDLGSTHGSTLNKTPLQPRVYCRMRVGHMCKFGGSTRLFILQGPDEDREEESELTVTELKEIGQKRQERQQQQQERLDRLDGEEADPEADQKTPAAPAAPTAPTTDEGISWGMAEDADEESDLQFNPFALGEAENEQLYLVDPKKTLRGWFEREGFELEYQTEELPGGRHVCRITLPLDTADGRPPVAEAQHVGKKKEAVFQCALEACRLLDRAGVLRQAKQESRQKRRQKPAGYDSDEDDTFLDRTGAVERKRQRRQQATSAAKAEQKADTYQSLLLQYQRVQSDALAAERRLKEMETATKPAADQTADVDELDAFMTRLSHGAFSDRQEKRRLKTQLTHLRSEEGRLCRLVNLARPASLPALKPPPQVAAVRSPLTGIIGKKKVKPGGAAGTVAGTIRGPAAPQQRTPAAPSAEEEEEDGGDGEDTASSTAPREDAAARLAPSPPDDADDKMDAGSERVRSCGSVAEEVDSGSGGGPSGSAADRGGTAARRPTGPCKPPAELSTDSPGPMSPSSRSPGPAVSPGPGNGRGDPADVTDVTDVADVATDSGVRPGEDSERGSERRSAARPAAGSACHTVAGDEAEGAAAEEAAAAGDGEAAPEDREAQRQPTAGAKRKRTPKNRRSGKLEAANSYSQLAGDGTYDVWVPPENQSGDGRTSLNDKFGY